MSKIWQEIQKEILTGKLGFTLIEVIVVVVIISVLTTIGVASYNSFNEKKVVEKAADELKVNLRLAQSKAINKEKDCNLCGGDDHDCTTTDAFADANNLSLDGWYVDFSNNIFYGECGNGSQRFGVRQLVNLDTDNDSIDDLELTYPVDTILFDLTGGTDLAAEAVFTISKGENSVDIIVDPSGGVK